MKFAENVGRENENVYLLLKKRRNWAEISLLDVKKSKDYRIFNRYRNRDRFREDSFFYV